ncbi:MAG: 23S rRNA (uracil(1939)-C(5))-methyltransferase RlmD [Clostridia bacterium]|nr:23S rRNA (uracil(1939)-C(5))-methyltransferase RlmD [Clostridia bacterium]
MMFTKNQIVTLDVTEINNLGCGVGKVDGMVFFVKGAVSGDRVEAKIIKTNKSYCVGRLEKILVPSQNRANFDFCRAPEACGGCTYRHVTYAHELAVKRDYVKSAFRKAGLSDVTVEETRTTGRESGYRNKAQYPFGLAGGKVTVGFFAGKTHKVIPCLDCALQPSLFSEICAFVCAFADEHGWSVYDEETGRGLLRHLYVREGKQSGEVMVCLVVNGTALPDEDVFALEIAARFPMVKSVMLNSNTKNTNVVLGRDYRTLRGRSYIEDVLCGKKFRISPASFYQVNHDGAELLYSIAAERASLGGDETLLDLYCGIGTIGISMATPTTRLVGVEIVQAAVDCARENAALNGLENAEFLCGDAGDATKLVDAALSLCGDPGKTTVVVDPPRKGLDAALVEYLADKQMKKVVYVSCDPDTLARDCALFRTRGYEIGAVTPVDMFPRTGHVESVVLLTAK